MPQKQHSVLSVAPRRIFIVFAFPLENSGDQSKKRLTVYTGPVGVLRETTELRTF